MRTTINLDDELIKELMHVSGVKRKREAIHLETSRGVFGFAPAERRHASPVRPYHRCPCYRTWVPGVCSRYTLQAHSRP